MARTKPKTALLTEEGVLNNKNLREIVTSLRTTFSEENVRKEDKIAVIWQPVDVVYLDKSKRKRTFRGGRYISIEEAALIQQASQEFKKENEEHAAYCKEQGIKYLFDEPQKERRPKVIIP